MSSHLWDEEGGVFTNRFPNGSFYRRVSPTSFYAMLANASTDAQAEAMVSRWLTNASRFAITPAGDFAGNRADNYWGLPSISADDPAFAHVGYWRGYVWGPMAQLTYWSLSNYAHVPAVRQARAALAKQMSALMMSQWREHRWICENYLPSRGGGCPSHKFYHWGALGGLLELAEEGYL